MSRTFLLATTLALAFPVLVATASTARAQGAPGQCGECGSGPGYAYGYQYAVPVAPPAPPDEVDLSNRLGVGIHAASMAIAPHDDESSDEATELAGGGLQIRYRISRRWELSGELATLREHDDDGEPFGDDVHIGTIGAAYHLRPGRHLDWYLTGGFGGMHVGEHHDDDGKDVRALGYLGIGVEYRWQHLALGAEVRGVGIAPLEDADGEARMGTIETEDDDRGDAAAQATIGATYYF